MTHLILNTLYSKHKHAETLSGLLNQKNNAKIHVKGLTGSSRSVFAANYIHSSKKTNLIILGDKEEAAYFYNDLTNSNIVENIFFFPSSYKRSLQYMQPENDHIILRTQTLNEVQKKNITIVTYPEAIIEKVVSWETLKKNSIQLSVGQNISIEKINTLLLDNGFTKVDFVYGPGQYSIRGGIVDVFSFADVNPFRVDFFGNEVESIRIFNIENQISTGKQGSISLTPDFNRQCKNNNHNKIPLLSIIKEASNIWVNNLSYIANRIDEIFDNTSFEEEEKKGLIINSKELLDALKNFNVIEFGQQFFFPQDISLDFNTLPHPAFNKNFELLAEDIVKNTADNLQVFILSENEKQIERLEAIFKDINQKVHFIPVLSTIHEGFIDKDLRVCCYTDHQIFDRYHKFHFNYGFSKSMSLTLKEINDLHPGDYIVHIDHGIGIFGGLEKITISNKLQEAIKLVYKNNDTLYVSIHSLHRISKYKGKDNISPKIYPLGSGAWQKLKQNTKSKVKDIAKELIELYAKRKAQKGFQFSPDTYLQNELEASFLYEDTPDQLKATKSVKEAMESDFPMDMLVCGDVGFGKTEVAIRAAFKAVADNKQVAVLVPTTILALQHYYTFTSRLKNFPCNVDYISRLKSAKNQKTTLKNLSEGKTDIIIGTHRLVGKDIQFKNLGLLIIDEEQKFGVAIKEKLKKIRLNVNTLTLTATPIPRTLQFSLMGARDLAIINTPPPNRHPILTELHIFNEYIIKEAIAFEIQRNGQIFFINNRVQNIYEIEGLINRISPEAKTIVAHGQMEGNKLEKIMLDFIDGEYDVLIATTIVESGLDIPNANTIIINNAHNFGLSDLHQMRGRVGRSNKKAFCYLLAPPLSSVTPEARKRLKAIEDFSDLGSGLYIAMQDLDIRGAGNLLGAEQSGFIADIGFETYHKILNEAIQELKENEFKDLYFNETKDNKKPAIDFISDCLIDTDLELLFPENYIYNISERMRLYRELDNIGSEEELNAFETRLTDRFGPIPDQSKELLNVVRMRWLAMKLGFEKIFIKNEKMISYFISNPTSLYYQSDLFGAMISYIQKQKNIFKVKEEKNKLTLTVNNINNISAALELLEKINKTLRVAKQIR